jgi:hypothetical protein
VIVCWTTKADFTTPLKRPLAAFFIARNLLMELHKDNFGREIHADSWIVSIFGNCGQAYARYYYIKGYADDGRLNVHEYNIVSGPDWSLPVAERVDRPLTLVPVRKPQTIKCPNSLLIYPFELLKDFLP